MGHVFCCGESLECSVVPGSSSGGFGAGGSSPSLFGGAPVIGNSQPFQGEWLSVMIDVLQRGQIEQLCYVEVVAVCHCSEKESRVQLDAGYKVHCRYARIVIKCPLQQKESSILNGAECMASSI